MYGLYSILDLCVCERARDRVHRKQSTVLTDEADGNHSLDREDREEVGEEEMGLAVK